MANHLGNVLNVITDHKLPNDGINNDLLVNNFTADVISYSDYYPFGMQIKSRNGSNESYRYGFQGQERDDEIKGEGNSYTTFYRQHDPRLGRWLSLDPEASSLPWQSSFSSMDNNPILNNDELGDKIGGNRFMYWRYKAQLKVQDARLTAALATNPANFAGIQRLKGEIALQVQRKIQQ